MSWSPRATNFQRPAITCADRTAPRSWFHSHAALGIPHSHSALRTPHSLAALGTPHSHAALGTPHSALLAGGRFIVSLLFGLTPHDPLTLGTAIVLLAIVGLIAGFIPARRASRVDPVIALRCEYRIWRG